VEEKNRLKIWHGLLASGIVILFMIFGGIPMYAIFGEVGGYLAGIVVALIALLFVCLTKTKASEVFPMALPPVRQFFAAVAMFVGVYFLNAAIGLLQAQIIPNFYERQSDISGMVRTLSPAVAVLLVAVQPAVCEEFFCRGFLVAAFRKLKHEWMIILVTSVFFGALHLDLYSFLPTAVIGAFFAFLALRTGSLLLPMILHFANNAFSVVLAYGSDATSEGASVLSSLSAPMLISYLLFYLGIALFFLWFGGRWFSGKKIFCKSGLIAFILSALLSTVGVFLMVVGSMELLVNDEKTIPYTDKIAYELPLTLEEGIYGFSVIAEADDPVRIAIKRGDEFLVSTEYRGTQSLSQTLVLEKGEYVVAVLSEEGQVLDGGNATVSIMILKTTVGVPLTETETGTETDTDTVPASWSPIRLS